MIRLRNLDPSLIAWIMQKTGLGPGIGRVVYIAPTASAYYDRLIDDGNIAEANLFTSLSGAFTAVTADRNDLILAYPGTAYLTTASLAWNKGHTHLIGLGGPEGHGHDYSYAPNVVFYTTTTEQNDMINLTGANCQFHSVHIQNRGNHASNLAGVVLNGYGAYFKNCSIQGTMMANQRNVVAACSLEIQVNGSHPVFEDCIIGENLWGVRSAAASGVINFTAVASGPQNGIFRRCRILSQSETSTVGLVKLTGNVCVDRVWTWDNCLFANFSTNWVNTLASAFINTLVQTNIQVLKDCILIGVDEWQTGDYGTMFVSNSPQAHANGGVAVEATS